MSELSHALGDLDATRARIDEAVSRGTESGADHLIAYALHRRGRLARLEGDRHQAQTSHHRALRLWDQTGQHVGVASALEALGGLAADEGRTEHAARLAAAHAFWKGIGYGRPPAEQAAYDADVASAREAIAPEAFAAAWEQGEGLSLTEAVAYATKGRGSRRRNWRQADTASIGRCAGDDASVGLALEGTPSGAGDASDIGAGCLSSRGIPTSLPLPSCN